MTLVRYYRVVVDPTITNGWFLGEPIDTTGKPIDARIFTKGAVIREAENLVLPIKQEGEPLGFLLAAFDMPVVKRDVGELLEKIVNKDEIQRIPVLLDTGDPGYEILNVTKRVACVDESRGEVVRWTENDHRADLAGRYRVIRKMKLDYNLIGNSQMFRILDYEIALIVSEKIKTALETIKARGIAFLEV